jgi:hypothetical protein
MNNDADEAGSSRFVSVTRRDAFLRDIPAQALGYGCHGCVGVEWDRRATHVLCRSCPRARRESLDLTALSDVPEFLGRSAGAGVFRQSSGSRNPSNGPSVSTLRFAPEPTARMFPEAIWFEECPSGKYYMKIGEGAWKEITKQQADDSASMLKTAGRRVVSVMDQAARSRTQLEPVHFTKGHRALRFFRVSLGISLLLSDGQSRNAPGRCAYSQLHRARIR